MNKVKFEPAPMDVMCLDVWPPGRLTRNAKDAYDTLAERGRIMPVSASRDKAGRVLVRYMADIPQEWIREELAEVKRRGRQMDITEIMEAKA